MNQKSSNNVRAIERALEILLCFSWYERELTLTEISERLKLAKSTTSRILSTLESMSFLTRDAKTNMYRLGNNIYYLGLIARESMDLRNIAYPIMLELNEKTQETINLYLLDNLERVCFDQIESPHALKQTVKIGERFPLWDGATGRIILSNLDESIWHNMKKDLNPITNNTIVDPDIFIQKLCESKISGFAVSVGEKNYDVGCVAAPIFKSTGEVLGCISISGPRFRFPNSTDQFAGLVVDAAKRISTKLGYYGKPVNFNV